MHRHILLYETLLDGYHKELKTQLQALQKVGRRSLTWPYVLVFLENPHRSRTTTQQRNNCRAAMILLIRTGTSRHGGDVTAVYAVPHAAAAAGNARF